MKSIHSVSVFLAFLLMLSAHEGRCQDVVLDSLVQDGTVRYHYVYVPETLLPERPLVIMLHGYGGKADGYRPEMLSCAKEEGFAVCIPQGLKAPKGKTGWYAGYPAQEGMRRDDAGAREAWDELEKSIVANLADEVEIYIQGSHVELVIYKKF